MEDGADLEPEVSFKVLLVGGPAAGKTSLVRRLVEKPFRAAHQPTLGFDVIVLPLGTHAGRSVLLELWDVSGNQLFCQPCHHGLLGFEADAVVFVFDLSSAASAKAVDDWHAALTPHTQPGTCKLLLAHKADLPSYAVGKEALETYVSSAGFLSWHCTVGSSDFGDYDVGARRGGAVEQDEARRAVRSRQLSVAEVFEQLKSHLLRERESAARDADGRSYRVPQLVDHISRRGGGNGGGGSASGGSGSHGGSYDGSSGGGAAANFGPEGSEDMLWRACERGTEPLVPWRAPEHSRALSAAAVARLCQGQGMSADVGWRAFAGGMEREEAEALLRGRPEGTYLLRRKGPHELVLTFVGKSGGHGGGGSGSDASSASVQHVLILYKNGHFTDEKRRLGVFPTLDDFLSSKVSKLAFRPLRFRRAEGSCAYVEEKEEGDGEEESGESEERNRTGSYGRNRSESGSSTASAGRSAGPLPLGDASRGRTQFGAGGSILELRRPAAAVTPAAAAAVVPAAAAVAAAAAPASLAARGRELRWKTEAFAAAVEQRLRGMGSHRGADWSGAAVALRLGGLLERQRQALLARIEAFILSAPTAPPTAQPLTTAGGSGASGGGCGANELLWGSDGAPRLGCAAFEYVLGGADYEALEKEEAAGTAAAAAAGGNRRSLRAAPGGEAALEELEMLLIEAMVAWTEIVEELEGHGPGGGESGGQRGHQTKVRATVALY